VATALLVNRQNSASSTLVFDDIDGRWVAVTVRSGECENIATDVWAVFTLQPRPDGTLSGEFIQASPRGCVTKQTPALTRTGDVDSSVQVADPETQPPRLVSEAQGLHGRYHDTLNYADGYSLAQDEVVRTDCLRTGDRCMSLAYGADGVAALVFANGKWTKGLENKSPCEAGGTALEKYTADYALPLPPQDPITVLTGRGHLEVIGTACAVGVDFDEKFERTGD
jgi:serine/threonine-protein kinase